MPAPRKIDRLPQEVRAWLQEELRREGFANYLGITERLAEKLDEAGIDETISKSAVHEYGQKFKDYAAAEQEARDQIATFLRDANMRDEIDVTNALFQQLSALVWRLQMKVATEGGLDPRGAKDLTTALNNLIRSTSLRSAIIADEKRRMDEALSGGVEAGQIDKVAAQKAREIMGFA